jgi:transcriptional regulator with XRE-family HTH domain
MTFGHKLRKLREEKGVTQQTLATKLGYVTNSYIADAEDGKFIPSKKKLKKIAKALNVPYYQINSLLIESKIEELGIHKPELIALVRDIPKMSEKEIVRIIEVYLKIRKEK